MGANVAFSPSGRGKLIVTSGKRSGSAGHHARLVLLAMALLCASCARSPCRFIVQFEWTGPLTWVESSPTHRRRSLTAVETALVTQTATTTLAAAYAEFPRVCVGARGKPTDVLHVLYHRLDFLAG